MHGVDDDHGWKKGKETRSLTDFKEKRDAQDAVRNLNGSKLHGQRVIVELYDTLKSRTKHAKCRTSDDRDKGKERDKRADQRRLRDNEDDERKNRIDVTHRHRRTSVLRSRSRSISNQDSCSRRRTTRFASYSNSRSRSNEGHVTHTDSKTPSSIARPRYSKSRSRTREVRVRHSDSRTRTHNERVPTSHTHDLRLDLSDSKRHVHNERVHKSHTREVRVRRSSSRTRTHNERLPTSHTREVRINRSDSRRRAHQAPPLLDNSRSPYVSRKRRYSHSRDRSSRRCSTQNKNHSPKRSRSRSDPRCIVIDDSPEDIVAPSSDNSRKRQHFRPEKFVQLEHLTDCISHEEEDCFVCAPTSSIIPSVSLPASIDSSISGGDDISLAIPNYHQVDARSNDMRNLSRAVQQHAGERRLSDYIRYCSSQASHCPTKLVNSVTTTSSIVPVAPLVISSDSSSGSNLPSPDTVSLLPVVRDSERGVRAAMEQVREQSKNCDHSKSCSQSSSRYSEKIIKQEPTSSLEKSEDSPVRSASPSIVWLTVPPIVPAASTHVLSNPCFSRNVISPDALISRQIAVANVELKTSVFHRKHADLLKLTLLGGGPFSAASNKRQQNATFSFVISKDNITTLTAMYTNPTAYRVCVRFFEASTVGEQDDYVPEFTCVSVNSHSVLMPNLTKSEEYYSKKQQSQPIDITSFCRLTPNAKNIVSVAWIPETKRRLCFAVHLLRHYDAEELIETLVRRGIKKSEYTRSLIRSKLTANAADKDITTTSIRISLLCPLGKVLMTMPCRSYSCKHLQCFDALAYVKMNEKKSTWICPICDKSAPFELLFIDGYFTEIVQTSSVDDIQLTENGNWYPVGSATREIEGVKTERRSTVYNEAAAAIRKTSIDVVDLTD